VFPLQFMICVYVKFQRLFKSKIVNCEIWGSQNDVLWETSKYVINKCRDRLQLILNGRKHFVRLKPTSQLFTHFTVPHITSFKFTYQQPRVTNYSSSTTHRLQRSYPINDGGTTTVFRMMLNELLNWECLHYPNDHNCSTM
jgi:hypothetical protein